MLIKHLTVRNIRGVTGHWLTTPVNMIIGDNWRGKSALLHALRLAIFGWVPHARKDAEMPPRRMMSGNDMYVAIELEDGRSFSRSWQLKGETVSAASVPKDYELAPAIMLDPKQYFDASPAKRMQFVFNSVKLPAAEFSVEAIQAALKNIKLETHTEDTEKAILAVVEEFDSVRKELADRSIQEFVQQLIEDFTSQQKLAKQTADRMNQTVAGLTELQLKKPEQFDEEIGEVDALLVAKREELGKLNQEKGRLEELLKTIAQRMSKRTVEAGLVESEASVLKSIEVNDADVAKAEAALKEQPSIPAGLLDEAYQKLNVAKKDVEDSTKEVCALQDQIVALNKDIGLAKEAISSERRRLSNDEAERDTDLNHESCPTCDAPGVEWRTRINDRYTARAAKADVAIANQNGVIAGCQSRLTDLTTKMEQAKGELELNASVLNAANKEAVRIAQEIQTSDSNIAKLQSFIREANARRETFGQKVLRIAEAKQFLNEIPVESDAAARDVLALVESNRTRITTEGQALGQRRTQIIASKATAANQMQAVAERDLAQVSLEVWKSAIKVLTEFQKKMVDTAFGSMMETANKFTIGILDSPLEYRDGEIGRLRDGRFVPQDQFSDAEQIITYAAMSVALAASAEFRIVLVDELTRVRGERKRQIVDRMRELVEQGVIHQFFAVDVQTDDGLVPSYYLDLSINIMLLK